MTSWLDDLRKPRNRSEQRAARALARETEVPYMKALLRLRAEKEAAPEHMPEGVLYPYVDELRASACPSDDALVAAVADRFDVASQTARWWLHELGLVPGERP